MYVGGISSEICKLRGLSTLNVENNPDLHCYPSCLNAMTIKMTTDSSIVSNSICATYQDIALCGLIAATSIGQSYSSWSCTTDGRTRSNPCDPLRGAWSGLSCSNGQVTSISISGLSGMYVMYLLSMWISQYIDCMNIDWFWWIGSLPSSLGLLSTLNYLGISYSNFIQSKWSTVVIIMNKCMYIDHLTITDIIRRNSFWAWRITEID